MRDLAAYTVSVQRKWKHSEAYGERSPDEEYLSNNKLYVTQAEILTKLIIGRFAFEPQLNGNLSLVFNG